MAIDEVYLLESDNVIKQIPSNKKFICLFSGGKDSALALSLACQKSTPVAIISCIEEEKTLFHKHNKQLTDVQSKKMNIPVEYFDGHWKNWMQLSRLYRRYRNQGVEFVVFGDLCNIIDANYKIRVCQAVGLTPCMPLWDIEYDMLIKEFSKHNIKSVISIVRAKEIEDEWLGRFFDEEAYLHFKSLGIDPMGEKGEFHTTLVDAHLFSSPIKYSIGNKQIVEDKFGKKLTVDVLISSE